jgi:hypothetical protein
LCQTQRASSIRATGWIATEPEGGGNWFPATGGSPSTDATITDLTLEGYH